jgi:hypothetical protein
MNAILARRPLALVLVPALALVSASAQKSDLKRALPAHTICYLALPDIDTSLAELQRMPLGKMWAEKEVQDFFADILKLAQQQWQQGMKKAQAEFQRQNIPFAPDDLLKLRVHGLTLALTTCDFKGGEDGPPIPRIGVLGHVNFGSSAPGWAQLIDFLIAQLRKEDSDAIVTERELAGARVVTINGEGNPTDMAGHLAFVGDSLVFGTLEEEVTSALEALKQTRGVLTESKAYKATFAQLETKGAEMELWLQPGPLMQIGLKALDFAGQQPGFPREVNAAGIRRAIETLGLDSVQAIGCTSSYVGDRCVSKSYVLAPQAGRSGLFAGKSKPISLDFLRWTPKDASSVSAMTFDLSAIYDTVVRAIDAYDPQVGKHLLDQLAAIEQKIGVSLKQDLLQSLGDEWISWSMPFQALGQMPPMSMLIKVRDEQRFVKTLDTLTKLSDGHLELVPVERSGVKMNHLKVNLDLGGGGPFDISSMISPYFAFKNGYMVATMSAQDLRRTLERLDRADEPSGDVRANPEFATYLAQLPREPICSLSLADWKANFEGIYQMIAGMLAFVPIPDEVPIDLSLLPDVGTLTKHLCGAISYTVDDGNGWNTVNIGPFGPETAIAVGAGIGIGAAAVMPRVVGQARRRGR